MSEVHRYQVVKMLSEGGNKIAYGPNGPWIVMARDFDWLTAERDALQQRLTAADERADELEGLLREAVGQVRGTVGNCDDELADRIDAALKPAEVQRNQCDGCQAGIPVVNGAHRMGKPGGYPDTMSCTAKMYVEERPDGCCCPPKGHTGIWAAAMCPVHQGLRALKR